jgi:uncharacterized protein DUF4412
LRRSRVSIIASTLTLALAVALAAPASAGIHYTAVTNTEDAAGKSARMEVEGWVDGEKAKVLFKNSDNPAAHSGTYLVTRDGGKTLYLVDPEEKTYAEWDLAALLGLAGNILQGMGPLLKFEFSDPKVEKLAEEDGGPLLGLPTRHTRFRTSYTMKMRVFGIGNSADTVSEQEIWSTTRLQDPALGVWLRTDPPRTGNAEFDKLIAAEREKVSGFPLKTVTVNTTTQKKGKQNVTRSTMEVTKLENQAVAGATFEIPAGYQETQMLPARPGT